MPVRAAGPIIAVFDDDVDPATVGARAWTNAPGAHGAVFTKPDASGTQALGSVATGPLGSDDYGGHGTVVASIAVDALDRADAPGRILGVGFAITAAPIAGFERAVDYVVALKARGEPIRIVNASLGVFNKDPAVQERWREACAKLASADILLVCAAPDEQRAMSANDLPAALDLPNVVSVAALDKTGAIATHTASGALVGALGVDVEAKSVYGYYLRTTGTSSATPIVAAALAAWFARYPSATAAQAKAALASSATPAPGLVAGRLDLAALLATPPR